MEQIKKTEIVFYDKGKTTELFPKTEINSVIDTSTGLTVRQYIDEIKSGIKDIEEVSIPELENRVTELEEKGVDLSGYYTKVEVDNKVASQNIYIQGIDERVNDLENAENLEPEDFKTINGESLIGSGDIKVQVEIDTSDLATKEELESLDNKKQDSLVSGQNIKSINGESLVGSGNLILEAEGLEVIEVTQEEYDNLTSYDPNVLYAISDGIMGLQFRVLTEAEYNSLTSYSDNIVYVVKDKTSRVETKLEESSIATGLNIYDYNNRKVGYRIGDNGELVEASGYSVSGLINLEYHKTESMVYGEALYINCVSGDITENRYRWIDSDGNVRGIWDGHEEKEETIKYGTMISPMYIPEYAKYIQIEVHGLEDITVANYQELLDAGITGDDLPLPYESYNLQEVVNKLFQIEKRLKLLEG